MILFFGTKPGKQIKKPLNHIACNHCKQTGTLSVTLQSNYLHLFWVPLFKIGTSRFVKCSHCKKVYYKDEFTIEMEKIVNSL
ncbi:zinc-ribbon domain-containing protein [Croceitalea rosinachiae]|uniref:Zinc-ribbon domain-containing protein n=1 Tax=Croceitalea rosinachiae TaxID=3075596 RepID=A0ABU3A8V1_9FLAO|nr:zinc-ribbon domain-containing protein [Croceitalea sp. F388]MDT0605518.1 zinc-ribbon domain-containing protein [Croceitalea sp. F388]